MKLRPINGRVAVRRIGKEEKTAGGIIIPDTAQEKSSEGEVVAVAPDATDELAVGDRIIFREFGGTEVDLDGEEYVLLESDDILVKYVSSDKIPT